MSATAQRGLQLVACSVVLLVVGNTLAASPADTSVPPAGPNSTISTLAPSQGAVVDPYAFVASEIDVGLFYFRPRLSIGYGEPFKTRVAFDLNPIFGSEGIGAWAGLRLAIPGLDLRVGARYQWTFNRTFLEPLDAYTRAETELAQGPKSTYVSLEAELSFGFRAGPGFLFGENALTHTLLVDDGFFVYEETIRAVIDPPWTNRTRVGYSFPLGPKDRLEVGPAVEVLILPKRDVVIVRAGLLARMKLYDDLEVRGNFMPAVATPDNLGIAGGDSFQIGIRWKWSTGL